MAVFLQACLLGSGLWPREVQIVPSGYYLHQCYGCPVRFQKRTKLTNISQAPLLHLVMVISGDVTGGFCIYNICVTSSNLPFADVSYMYTLHQVIDLFISVVPTGTAEYTAWWWSNQNCSSQSWCSAVCSANFMHAW